MEEWREVWRRGFGPVMPTKGLEGLLKALEEDDGRLRQGTTTSPPPLLCAQDHPCEGADAVGFVGWAENDMDATVGDVNEFFARACFDCDRNTGDVASCRYFLNFWDDEPRGVVMRELAHEVKLTLLERLGILTRLHGPIPDGFTNRFVANNCGEATDYAVLADWLDENDRAGEAAMCRDAADTLFLEANRAMVEA